MSIGSEHGKQVDLGEHLGMVGTGVHTLSQGSHDLVSDQFPAEILASCSQIYFCQRSWKPRIPSECNLSIFK